MLTIELARRLVDAGLVWQPGSGDRFVVPVKGMEEDVFVISEITVDVHHFTTGDVIGFNGTTEWALDSVEQDKVVWLPREDQLRDLLGDAFVSLERLEGGYAVTIRGRGGDPERHVDIDAERAYARAAAAALGSSAPDEEQSA
ncbi:MAG: pilus assembly protein CpaE [Dermatophilaceae bacterium]|nr:pilus assembly protein CpaE [Dermatophilaceae bacterium]NUR79513.1 pilus assembly protein CpaE [Dermatophilaceae bacterium]